MDKVNPCYSLIEFPDKSTDVVPDNWLFEQKCYWPNYNQAKLKAAVKRKEPVQDGWKVFEPVRLLKKCETLEKAQKMLKKYVDCDIHTSEITSDEEGHERIKRKKRPNPRFLNFIENESDQDDDAPKKSRLAAPPAIVFPESHMNFETSPAVSNLSSLERHMNYHASSPASDITSAENSHRVHQGTHQGSEHTNLGAHKGTNYVAHQGSHYGAHQGTYQEAIHGALQDPNNGAHQGSHNGALQGSHYGAHQGPHNRAHQGSHYGAHQASHYGAHQGPHNRAHQGSHYGAHQASHYGAHQGPHNRAHQGSNYGAHQGPHNGAHQGTYQDANNRAHQGSQYGAHQGTLTELVNENPRAQLTSQGNEHTNELSPFKRNVLKLLMEVKAELKEQRAMIQNLQGVPAVPDQEIRCGLQLPLQSLEDFEELERLDETEKNRLIYQLSLLGGHKLEGTIRKMLSHILSNKLASSLNWAGRGEKRSFETSNLSKIMFRALRNTAQGKEASKADFSEAVKRWLRYAPDREGGSGRRSSVI